MTANDNNRIASSAGLPEGTVETERLSPRPLEEYQLIKTESTAPSTRNECTGGLSGCPKGGCSTRPVAEMKHPELLGGGLGGFEVFSKSCEDYFDYCKCLPDSTRITCARSYMYWEFQELWDGRNENLVEKKEDDTWDQFKEIMRRLIFGSPGIDASNTGDYTFHGRRAYRSGPYCRGGHGGWRGGTRGVTSY